MNQVLVHYLKFRMFCQTHTQVKIPRRAPSHACLTSACHPQPLAIRNAGWDFHLVGLGPRHLSGAPGGLNGSFFLKGPGAGQTVFNDTQIDRLKGANGSDWFFADPTGTAGETTDRSGSEQLVDL